MLHRARGGLDAGVKAIDTPRWAVEGATGCLTRWRMFLWVVTSYAVWSFVEPTWSNILKVILAPGLLSGLLLLLTKGRHLAWCQVSHVMVTTAYVSVVHVAVIVTSRPEAMAATYLMKKVAWQEAWAWRTWSLGACITVATVVMVTLIVKRMQVKRSTVKV